MQTFPAFVAVAVASGLSPFYGISCAAIASLVASAFGDSKVRISAPSILFIPAVLDIATRHGIFGVCLATALAGLLMVFFGAIGFGRAIQMLPRPIILGLYTGIAFHVATANLPAILRSAPGLVGETGWRSLGVLSQLGQLEPAAIILGLAGLLAIVPSGRKFKTHSGRADHDGCGCAAREIRTPSASQPVCFESHTRHLPSDV
jgi:SulP family sulfate permease